jgi:hypothetical protein
MEEKLKGVEDLPRARKELIEVEGSELTITRCKSLEIGRENASKSNQARDECKKHLIEKEIEVHLLNNWMGYEGMFGGWKRHCNIPDP